MDVKGKAVLVSLAGSQREMEIQIMKSLCSMMGTVEVLASGHQHVLLSVHSFCRFAPTSFSRWRPLFSHYFPLSPSQSRASAILALLEMY